jgi:hypothetical protein
MIRVRNVPIVNLALGLYSSYRKMYLRLSTDKQRGSNNGRLFLTYSGTSDAVSHLFRVAGTNASNINGGRSMGLSVAYSDARGGANPWTV